MCLLNRNTAAQMKAMGLLIASRSAAMTHSLEIQRDVSLVLRVPLTAAWLSGDIIRMKSESQAITM